jgi:hypothetical protein
MGKTSPRYTIPASSSSCLSIVLPFPTSLSAAKRLLFVLAEKKIGAELHVYLEEGTYHKRLFRGLNTDDMKK